MARRKKLAKLFRKSKIGACDREALIDSKREQTCHRIPHMKR
jgi:hypothetical protein